MFVRYADFALPAKGVVFAFHLQLFDLQLVRFQIQLRAQAVDRSFEECEGSSLEGEMPTKFAVACVHRSFDSDFPGKIAWICAKKSCEIAKLIDRRRNIPAKIGAKPAG